MGKKPAFKTNVNEVRLGSKIHSFLINAVKKYTSDTSFPQIYLLGKDKKTDIVQKAILLKCSGGCSNMPGIVNQSLHKSYISLVRKNLIPCGLARVARNLPNSADWNTDDGGPAGALCGEYMISVDADNMKAYTATNVRRDGKYVYDYNIKPLPIRITDK